MRVPPGSQLVFDQVVQSDTSLPNVYGLALRSDPKLNDWLGRANDVKLFAVVDRATASGTAAVGVEEAGDEELAWTGTYGEGFPLFTVTTSQGMGAGADVEANRPAFPTAGTGPRQSLGFRRIWVAFSSGTTSATARVRVWATGHNGYRRFHRLLIAERLQGTTPLTGPLEACAWLAACDLVTVGFQTDEVSGTGIGGPQLSVLVGASPNGRTWVDSPAGPYSITSGKVYPLAIFVSGGFSPLYGFIRFGVQLAGADHVALVRFWVTGRDIRSS